MTRKSNSGVQRFILALFVVTIAWLATARADEVLDRSVRFRICVPQVSDGLITIASVLV